jgi:hypothetical protein
LAQLSVKGREFLAASHQAAPMNHSFYSADRATHRRVIGSAFVAIFVVTLFGVGLFAKSEREAGAAPILKAGIPLATTDGGYVIIR